MVVSFKHFPDTRGTQITALIIGQAPARVIIKVKGHQHRWLAVVMTWQLDIFRGG